MKPVMNKIAFVALSLMIALPNFARAEDRRDEVSAEQENLQTSKRPDIAFIFTNNTNNPVTFIAKTYCADFPGTLVIQPHQQRYLIWGEAMDHGTCAILAKDIQLRAVGYNFLLDAAAEASNPITKPTCNEEWSFDVNGDGGITVNRSWKSSRDLYVEMSINK